MGYAARAMTADELGLVGSTVARVRFDACVDAGGFGVVYRGFDLPRGIRVAIKCLRIPYATRSNPELAKSVEGRFKDESKLLAKLSEGHSDVVRCLGSGTLVAPATAERTPYMVLEWLEGRTLSAELRARRAAGGAVYTLADTIALMESAVSALAYAHAQEVIHRDVKPANLFLAKTSEGVRMKVLDFGVAKILVDDIIGMKPSVETGLGVQFCSPSYGAPEQFSPGVGPMGPWTDVYALALVVLELLSGTKVRAASTLADGAIKALDPQSGSPRASSLGVILPPRVEDVLARAVALDPRARPRDAGVFWAELRAAAEESKRPAAFGGTMLMAPPPKAQAFNMTMPLARPMTPPPQPPVSRGTAPLAMPLAPPGQAPAPLSPLAASMWTEPPVQPPPPRQPSLASVPPPRAPMTSLPPRASLPPAGVPARAPGWVLPVVVTLVGALVGAVVLGLFLWQSR